MLRQIPAVGWAVRAEDVQSKKYLNMYVVYTRTQQAAGGRIGSGGRSPQNILRRGRGDVSETPEKKNRRLAYRERNSARITGFTAEHHAERR